MELLSKYYLEKNEKVRNNLIEEMLNDYEYYLDLVLNNILNNVELRNNAYLLNIMSKKKKVCDYLNKKFKKEHFNILVNDENSKTRKNTYIFMGNFVNKEYVVDLVKLLKKEETNYCISSLILSLGNYKIKNIEEILEKYISIVNERLNRGEILEVHYNEIVNSVNKVLNKSLTKINHEFTKLDRELDLYLTCMPSLSSSCYNKVKALFMNARKYKDGVIVNTSDIDKVYRLRCFYECLISLNGNNLDKAGIFENIREFLSSDILENSHKGDGSFNYRIEFVSNKNKQDKLNVYNEVNSFISDNFDKKYLNNPSLYEFEIRIIDNEDNYDVFYKLCTYKDKRYDYRVKDLPASINPSSANMMLEEVRKYLKKDASVLDPFCGTSTMLIERSHISSCTLTGVDIDKRAIEYSYINSNKANVKVNLVNKNILDFEGYFDEIISNMPYGNRVSNHRDNEVLYKAFINKIPSILNDDGVAILLTSELSLMKKVIKNNKRLKLVKDIYTETGGLTPHLFVIKKA